VPPCRFEPENHPVARHGAGGSSRQMTPEMRSESQKNQATMRTLITRGGTPPKEFSLDRLTISSGDRHWFMYVISESDLLQVCHTTYLIRSTHHSSIHDGTS
jgi:hypothetical protein